MILHKKVATLAAVLMLMLLTSLTVLANSNEHVDKQVRPVDDNSIVLGVYDAPPSIIHENGDMKGISPQYVKVIEMLTDLDMTLKPMPYSRLVFNRVSDDLDMVNAFISAELEESGEILTRTGQIKAYLVTLKGVDLSLKSPSDKVSVSITRGLRSLVADMDPPAPDWWNIVGVKDEQHGLRAVMLGRIDGAYITDIAYDYFTQTNPAMKAAKFTTHDAGMLDVYLWTRKGEVNKPKYQRLKKVVDRMSFNGQLPIKWWDISDFLDFFSRSE